MLSVEKLWSKVQEFIGRVDNLEDDNDETKKELAHLKREVELLRKEAAHDQKVSAKVQEQQGLKVVELEQRLAKVEREKHGKAISAGIAKSQLEKMKNEKSRRN